MARRDSALERGVLGGLAAFRAVAWAWMLVVLVVSRVELRHPVGAVAAGAGAGVLTVALALAARSRPRLLHPVTVVVEVAAGVGLLAADGWVYGGPHRVSLGSAWPIAGVLSAGVVAGPVGGAAAGVALGLGRLAATAIDDLPSPGVLSLLSTTFLFALAGAAAGVVMDRLRRAEDQIAAARAREEVARTLHDGVLQTLAVVQRRSTDGELADLARTQERELRDFLFGVDRPPGDLLTELRGVTARAEARLGVGVEVAAVGAPRSLTGPVVQAASGAVGEAITNAAKHGGASRVVVFVDLADDDRSVTVSIDDDGVGFDPATTDEGVGLSRSIRGRIADVGGHVEVSSAPGRGTAVRLHLPA